MQNVKANSYISLFTVKGVFLSPLQWFWLSLGVLNIQKSFIIDCDKLCKVIEMLWEMALQLVASFTMAMIFAGTLNFAENSG